jgi:predicted transglutaminase-like protease
MSLLDKIRQYFYYRQFVPTKKDLDNDDLQKLAQRLKTDSFNKTLVNIVEWQERNIEYWDERWITSSILNVLLVIALGSITVFLGQANPYSYYLLLLFIPLILIGNYTLNIIIYLCIVFLYIILLLLSLTIGAPTLTISSNIFVFVILISFISGSFISLVLNLILKYKNIKRFTPDFKPDDTFKLSLPIGQILKYRLSICRDYAKFTSALLLKIYPEKEVFFVLIPKHVAVAIKSDGKFFVLDQRLPILTLDKWKEKWRLRFNKKDLDIDTLEIYLEKDKVEVRTIKMDNISFILDKSDIEELIKKLKELLKLQTQEAKEQTDPNLEFPVKNIVPLFCNENLFKDSLIELVKNKIEDELVGNINEIKNVDIELKNEDLILKIWLI